MNQVQYFTGKTVSDSGDGTDRTAADEAMTDLRINPDHQQNIHVRISDMLSGIAQRIGSAEFFETDKVWKLASQVEEQVCFCLKAVVRAVIDHGGEFGCRCKNPGEVGTLSRWRRSA